MSATRDKTQNFTFVYSNLYQIYRKGTEAAKASEPHASLRARAAKHAGSGAVLKTGDLKSESFAKVRVSPFTPAELLNKHIEAAAAPSASPAPKRDLPASSGVVAKAVNSSENVHRLHQTEKAVSPESARLHGSALDGLKENLKNLTDLHSRLKFMLTELEDIVREE